MIRKFLNKISFLFGGLIELRDLYLIRRSSLFDKAWYLEHNPDITQAKLNPAIHYLRFGGFEGRNPGPDFSSDWYLNSYDDVKQARINPLVHYLKYGRREGREILPQQNERNTPLYRCSVCGQQVEKFMRISSYYEDEYKKYGNPFSFDDFHMSVTWSGALFYRCGFRPLQTVALD